MKLVNRKLLAIRTQKYDFENEFCYVEIVVNGQKKDCFFVEKQYLNKDGSIKNGGIKYFHSEDRLSPEKTIKEIKPESFQDFENLYFYNTNGNILNINHGI